MRIEGGGEVRARMMRVLGGGKRNWRREVRMDGYSV